MQGNVSLYWIVCCSALLLMPITATAQTHAGTSWGHEETSDRVMCIYCSGSGTCKSCNGSGKSAFKSYELVPGRYEEVSRTCTGCNGMGRSLYGGGKCPACKGSGKLVSMELQPSTKKETVSPCSNCNGTGRCPHCGGSGRDELATKTQAATTAIIGGFEKAKAERELKDAQRSAEQATRRAEEQQRDREQPAPQPIAVNDVGFETPGNVAPAPMTAGTGTNAPPVPAWKHDFDQLFNSH